MYEWEVQMLTLYGWECVDTHDDRQRAIESRDNYRYNDLTSTYRHKRVKVDS